MYLFYGIIRRFLLWLLLDAYLTEIIKNKRHIDAQKG